MPGVGAFLATFVNTVLGTTIGAGVAFTHTAAIIAARVAALVILDFGIRQFAASPKGPGIRERQVLIRTAVAPRKIVYGEAVVSGPVMYANTAGAQNRDLYMAVALTGHVIDSYVAFYLNDDEILDSDVDSFPGGDGAVQSGKYAPIGGNDVVYLRGHLGADDQTVDTMLDAAFTDWTTAHRARGRAYLVARFNLVDGSESVWESGAPRNIRARIRGRLVYDPRLDSTQPGGSGAHRVDDESTWEWSENPVLCTADYMTRWTRGRWSTDRMDWVDIMVQADYCEVSVSVPAPVSTQDRYTCNGILFTTTDHRENMQSLLSSCNGDLQQVGGLWRIVPGRYDAPTVTLDEDDLIGPITYRKDPEANDRYNTVRGTYFDPDRDDKEVSFLEVTDAGFLTRDNNEVIARDITLPMTNTEFEAQRLAMQIRDESDNSGVCIFPCTYKALQLTRGELVNVNFPTYSWAPKIFEVANWKAAEYQGIELTLREKSTTPYTDPLVGDYGTRTAAGTITFPSAGVPPPTGLATTSLRNAIRLDWTNPNPMLFDQIDIYAAVNSTTWGSATKIGETRDESFILPVPDQDSRGFWLRAVNFNSNESLREPDNDTTTVTGRALPDNILFSETFDGYQNVTQLEAMWRNNGGAATVTLPDDGVLGGQVLQAAGDDYWPVSRRLVPYDPNAIYKVSARVRQTVRSSGGNDGFYLGLEGVAADGITRINQTGADLSAAQHYLGAQDFDMDTLPLNEWHTFTAYVSGNNTVETTEKQLPYHHGYMYTGVRFVRPLAILNWADGDGTMQLDCLIVERLADFIRPTVPDTSFDGSDGIIGDDAAQPSGTNTNPNWFADFQASVLPELRAGLGENGGNMIRWVIGNVSRTIYSKWLIPKQPNAHVRIRYRVLNHTGGGTPTISARFKPFEQVSARRADVVSGSDDTVFKNIAYDGTEPWEWADLYFTGADAIGLGATDPTEVHLLLLGINVTAGGATALTVDVDRVEVSLYNEQVPVPDIPFDADRTLSIIDAGTTLRMNGSTQRDVTMPDDVDIAPGSTGRLVNDASGAVNTRVLQGSGVTVRWMDGSTGGTGTRTIARYGSVRWTKITDTLYHLTEGIGIT